MPKEKFNRLKFSGVPGGNVPQDGNGCSPGQAAYSVRAPADEHCRDTSTNGYFLCVTPHG